MNDSLLQLWRTRVTLSGRRITLCRTKSLRCNWPDIVELQSIHCATWIQCSSVPRALDCEGSFIGRVRSRCSWRRDHQCIFRFQLADSHALLDYARGPIVGYVARHSMTEVVQSLCVTTSVGRDVAGLIIDYLADVFAVDSRAVSDNVCTCVHERGMQPCPPIVTREQILD